MEKTTIPLKRLKRGSFVVIDGVPCRVVEVALSAPGKHGAMKARIEAIGLFDERRHSLVGPADEEVEVPIVNKRSAQVVAIVGETVQLMDLSDYSVFELPLPEGIELKPGQEVSYYEVLGQRTLKPLK